MRKANKFRKNRKYFSKVDTLLSTFLCIIKEKTQEIKIMLARKYGLKKITGMFGANELQLVPIVCGKGEELPEQYLLYGQEIKDYSLALVALRDMCDEIARRSRSGLVLPRMVVSVDNVDALLLRSPDGEIARLLDILDKEGENCGVELVA